MEQYLIQIEHAKETGDDSQLAQLSDSLDNSMQAVADYLVQLDASELTQVTGLIQGQAWIISDKLAKWVDRITQ